MEEPYKPAYLPSFGRRRGRKLRPKLQFLLEEMLPKVRVQDSELAGQGELWLEIGFGGGEHLAAQAAANPSVSFIGCEPYLNGVATLLRIMEEQNLANIRILDGDARLLLEKMPPARLGRVFILFPDPWPKDRHHKRRIVNQETLDLLARAMRPGAELRLATDHPGYAEWIAENIEASPHFHFREKTPTPPPDWAETRYERKEKAGKPLFFTAVRVG